MLSALLTAVLAACGSPSAVSAQALPEPAGPEQNGMAQNGQIMEFPEEQPSFLLNLIEAVPTALTWPDRPMSNFFSFVLHAEHDEPETELEEIPIGLQEIPPRPPLLIEWNELFLGPGFLNQGIEMPTGVVWRPTLWVFGTFRSGIQYFDTHRPVDPIAEWANRLDLYAQSNLSGTERVLLGLRPLDEEGVSSRTFTGYDFRNGNSINGFNDQVQTLFFEGDFGEIFPGLDPYDSEFLDYGFSVGRIPIIAQQGLLINEDKVDAVTVTRNTLSGYGNLARVSTADKDSGVTVTRNTLSGYGNLNLRMTGVFAWDQIHRNSVTGRPNTRDHSSHMVALLTESDFYVATVNLDAVYVYSDGDTGDMFVFAASAIRRHYLFHNTYNTSLHVLTSIPTRDTTPFADQGELFFAQTSWTPHRTEDLIYLNGFWAVDQFTSPARGTLAGGPLGQTGIIFAAPGLGRAGAPIGNSTNDVAGASLGYQLFFDETRRQVIWEFGGSKETNGPTNRGAVATALRYQRAYGQHSILILDGFVGKPEGMDVVSGSRAELLIKF
ncbi:MAG: hypothetical protein HYS13_15895 [Planctomycetia bacterium]|nr:hypothetical protein [Planctomycetia bacterium]